MPEPTWKYNPLTHNYMRNGKFVAFAEIKAIALQAAEASADVVGALAEQLASDQLRLDHWQELMRAALKSEHLAQYMAGRGGKAQMTQRDYGIVGAILKKQYQFLDDFAKDIAAGKLSPAQIAARARMYIESAHQSFWRGRAEALGLPRLPTYPGQGDTQCLTRCRCELKIEEVRTPGGTLMGWNVTWVLDPLAQEVHCEDCPQLADVWNPLWVPAGMDSQAAEKWRAAELAKVASILAAEHSHYEHNFIDLGGTEWGQADAHQHVPPVVVSVEKGFQSSVLGGSVDETSTVQDS